MRRPLLLVAAAVLVGCAGGTTDTIVETGTATQEPPAVGTIDVTQSPEPSAATTDPDGEPIVIQASILNAAEEGAEPIATGGVLEASTLGGSPFCAGGTILDSHASLDPAVEPLGLIDRMITCSDGTVRIVFTPGDLQGGQPQPGQPQPGSWTIVSGTGAFEGLRGSGEMETFYPPDEDEPASQTLTGTVAR